LEAGAAAVAAALFTNPLILVIILIFGAVLFIVAYAFLWAWGLVTATVLFVAGLLMLYVAGKAGAVSKYPLLVLLPIGLGAVGYLADHVQSLSMISILDGVNSPVDPQLIAVLLLIAAVVILGAAVLMAKKKHGRRHR